MNKYADEKEFLFKDGSTYNLKQIYFEFWKRYEESGDISTDEEYQKSKKTDLSNNETKKENIVNDGSGYYQEINFQNYYKNYSREFTSLLNLLNIKINKKLFPLTKGNRYIFDKQRAEFVYEFLVRKEKEPVWNEIMKVNNANCDGFLKLYRQTRYRKELLEQLEFVINGLLKIYSDATEDEKNNLRMNLYIVTQYNIIVSQNYIEDKMLELPILATNNVINIPHGYMIWEKYEELFAILKQNIDIELNNFREIYDSISKDPTSYRFGSIKGEKREDEYEYKILIKAKKDPIQVIVDSNRTFLYEKISDARECLLSEIVKYDKEAEEIFRKNNKELLDSIEECKVNKKCTTKRYFGEKQKIQIAFDIAFENLGNEEKIYCLIGSVIRPDQSDESDESDVFSIFGDDILSQYDEFKKQFVKKLERNKV